MKAIVLHEYGGPDKLKYEDVDDPVPQAGEVLVHLSATSVNPVDYKLRSGALKEFMSLQFPAILGHDIAGIVRSLGMGVTRFKEGDRVMALGGRSYAEFAVVKESDLALIPENLDLTDAAALPLVTLTGQQLITRGVRPQAGQTLLVAGAVGGVGRTAVYTAKQLGATVIAGVRKRQLEAAEKLGADEVLALDDERAVEKLGFLDAVADCVGHETAEMLIGKVKQGGIFASVLGAPANANLHPTVRVESVQVISDAAGLRKLAEDVAARRFTVPIDRILPLSDAAKAQEAAEKGGLGKVLLSP